MNQRDKIMLSASAVVVGIASAIAWGVDPTSPGYNYGRINCGPMTNNVIRTQQACRNCCTKAEQEGALPNNQLSDCLSYCAVPCWVCWENL